MKTDAAHRSCDRRSATCGELLLLLRKCSSGPVRRKAIFQRAIFSTDGEWKRFTYGLYSYHEHHPQAARVPRVIGGG